jgi:hypothetical protein
MKSNFFKVTICILPLIVSISGCSDFRKAVGKEKMVPDEFSIASTPSLTIPPGYKIDPEMLNKDALGKLKNDFNLNQNIKIKNKNNASSFEQLFVSKNVPKNIRKIVDEETIGISLSERRGIDILFGNIPETGVVIDGKKEALRIRKNKASGKKLNSNPSPALEKSGKSLLIK